MASVITTTRPRPKKQAPFAGPCAEEARLSLLLPRGASRGWLPAAAAAAVTSVWAVVVAPAGAAASGAAMAVTAQPRPATIARPGAPEMVTTHLSPPRSGQLPVLVPSRISQRRWVCRDATAGKLGAADKDTTAGKPDAADKPGTAGTLDTPGTLGTVGVSGVRLVWGMPTA